jgi:SSS family solute:Na+ symporter
MDMLQLVFSFVNAPLFATFLLGMFWRRTTGHGAFWGLVSGTATAALHYELTSVAGASASLLPKLAVVHQYPSDMAQNFWGASWAWTICFVVTIAISLATPAKAEAELKGLVYGLTPRPSDEGLMWWQRPVLLGTVVLVLVVALNLIFW